MKFLCLKQQVLLWLALIYPALGHAGPMGFEGSWMAMGDMGVNWREAFINYAFTPRDAVGISNTFMRTDDKTQTSQLIDVTYTRLVHRWNMPDAQANIWFIGGVGALEIEDQNSSTTKTMISPGIQADYETQRVYLTAAQRLYRAENIQQDYSMLRAGFSFYTVDYDETQPWLIIEARRMQNLSDSTEITPMLRLINKNYFIEGGINTEHQFRFNFMYIF
jgi:hypothetical protein